MQRSHYCTHVTVPLFALATCPVSRVPVREAVLTPETGIRVTMTAVGGGGTYDVDKLSTVVVDSAAAVSSVIIGTLGLPASTNLAR
jgi:hypothetical protein